MQGLEILTSVQVATDYGFNTPVFWVVAIIVIGIAIVVGIIEMEVLSYSVMGVIIGLFLGVVSGGIVFSEPTEYETQYKVTISDETSMTEFLEQYDIIDQDGKIITVREKSNEGEIKNDK